MPRVPSTAVCAYDLVKWADHRVRVLTTIKKKNWVIFGDHKMLRVYN